MLKNKCCLYVIISIRFFSITICNLLIEFPWYKTCSVANGQAWNFLLHILPLLFRRAKMDFLSHWLTKFMYQVQAYCCVCFSASVRTFLPSAAVNTFDITVAVVPNLLSALTQSVFIYRSKFKTRDVT